MFAKHCATRLRPSASESATERLDGAVRELLQIASFARSTIHKELASSGITPNVQGPRDQALEGSGCWNSYAPKK